MTSTEEHSRLPRATLASIYFGHQLIGEGEREWAYSPWLADQERVVGMTVDGQEVTLVDCSQASGGGFHFPGIDNGVYGARAVIVGHIFDGPEPITVDAVEIRTSELETWVGIVPFPARRHSTGDGMTITVKRLPVMSFPLATGDTATLKFEINTAGLGGIGTKAPSAMHRGSGCSSSRSSRWKRPPRQSAAFETF